MSTRRRSQLPPKECKHVAEMERLRVEISAMRESDQALLLHCFIGRLKVNCAHRSTKPADLVASLSGAIKFTNDFCARDRAASDATANSITTNAITQ